MLKNGLNALRSGNWPTLLAAWLHFEVSFMVWLLIGAMGIAISQDFSLSASQKGLLVGFPVLGGAILRLVVGPLGDWFGAKNVGLGVLGLESIGLLLAWQRGATFEEMLGIGFLLGFAGASFAIALPLASQAYPTSHQGLAMGVAALGNSGVLLATFIAPRLAEMVGWHRVFGLMLIPVLGIAFIFWWLVKPSPPTSYLKTSNIHGGFGALFCKGLQDSYLHWLSLLYGVTFGGFVGLSSYLPIFLHDQFHLDMVYAGSLTALCALAGSGARPFGGFFADRFGGLNILPVIFFFIALISLGLMDLNHFSLVISMILIMMFFLGFGNGAVFQVASFRFKSIMGTASGFIGAAGGIGGFLLPSGFGLLKESTGSFSTGFFILGVVSGLAGISAMIVRRSIRSASQKSISSAG